MTNYVVGFLFDPDHQEVVLIKKQKGPPDIVGRWNGLGGKIEPLESPQTAMGREFVEECGLWSPKWTLFCEYLVGEDKVYFFKAAHTCYDQAETMEDEEVAVFPIVTLFIPGLLQDKVMHNLTWLIPMAVADYLEVVHVVETDEVERCPHCGYSEEDKALHGDHHLCERDHPGA